MPQVHIVDSNSKTKKLRFDSASASGSRAKPSKKHKKSEKKRHTNEHSTHICSFVKTDTKKYKDKRRFCQLCAMMLLIIFQNGKRQIFSRTRSLGRSRGRIVEVSEELGNLGEASWEETSEERHLRRGIWEDLGSLWII